MAPTAPSQGERPPFKLLSFDGGGAKGLYTLGVLREIEGMLGGAPLSQKFDLVFGTSTGSIIAALIGLGYKVDEITSLYRDRVGSIMRARSAAAKTEALRDTARTIFGDRGFDSFSTNVGIVSTKWATEKPMIFKTSVHQAHGRSATFVPGFGCRIADAVEASCSAFPFFERKTLTTAAGDLVELVDGGYCANNPTLYGIADATAGFGIAPEWLRVVSIGVGVYPRPKPALFGRAWFAQRLLSVELLQKTLEINTQSMEQLRTVLFRSVQTIRISDTFSQPEMATDMFEHNAAKLSLIHQRGQESFAPREHALRSMLVPGE